MPNAINKKPPVLVDGFAYAVIDSVSKAALVDLVADLLRGNEGDERLDGDALALAFAERHEPIAIARDDKPVNLAALRRKRDARKARHEEVMRRRATNGGSVPTMVERLGIVRP